MVAGAGIAGLTAAYRLQQSGWHVDVLESAAKPGGRVETIRSGGYVLDTGATALAARYPLVTELVKELDLNLIWTAPYLGVYRQGRIHLLRVDQLVRSAISTGLLSTSTKLKLARLAAGIALAKARGKLSYENLGSAAELDTETASHYVRRIAGEEADRYFAEPITRALLLANSDQVSRVELMSGLINAVAGRLSTVEGGQGAIIDALVNRIGSIRVNTRVEAIREKGSGVVVELGTADGSRQAIEADAAVIATPLPMAAAILNGSNAPLALLDSELEFTRAINVGIGTTVPADTPAFLLQMPADEDREVAMIIIENNKAPDRAPAGHGLLSVSWEMSASAQWFERSDEEIIQRSLQTVYKVFPALQGTVDFTYVKRWFPALPHTKPGVYRAIDRFTSTLDPASPIQFAADYLSQTGQNTAVAWGTKAAENILKRKN